MITQHGVCETASYDRIYNLETRGNIPYLILSSVQFTCYKCTKGAYIDMSLVPIHPVHVKCGVCDMPLFLIGEDEFEYELGII